MRMAFPRLCVFILFAAGFAAGEIKNVGWWKNTIFYQVYPRSFMDSNNDGVGDLKGITSKLEHFVESGIGGIWLSPIYASPMIDFGYDISDFRKVDEGFGNLEDFEELTRKAKSLGIKVVLDFVPNHSSDKHEWFIKSFNGEEEYKDYYIWRKGRANNTEPPNNWLSIFSGSAWRYNGTRGLWYLHQFEYRQADLNFSNPKVVQEMDDILLFWLGKGVDGFRIDSVNYIMEDDSFLDEPLSHEIDADSQDHKYLNHIYTKDDPRNYKFIQRWRNLVDDWANTHDTDEKIIMVEAYADLEKATDYYNFGAHIPFNFHFIMDIDKNSKPSDFKKIIDQWVARTPSGFSPNWVMGNHDRKRLATRYPGRADQMTMLTMILPGVAITYYGEEIGMVDNTDISWNETKDPQACNTDPERYQTFTRDPSRTPFQWNSSLNAGFSKASKTWLPTHVNYKELNLEKQKCEPQSYYKLYQTLTRLKKSSEALKQGALTVEVLNEENVLAILRKTSSETIALLINFSDTLPQTVDLSQYLPGVKSEATIVTASLASGIKWGSAMQLPKVTLPAKASFIIKADIQ